MMNFKKKIEESPLVFAAALMISGFGAGIGAYKTALEIAGLDSIRLENYIHRDEVLREYLTIKSHEKILDSYLLKESNLVQEVADLNKKNEELLNQRGGMLEEVKFLERKLSDFESAEKYTEAITVLIDESNEMLEEGDALREELKSDFLYAHKLNDFLMQWISKVEELLKVIDLDIHSKYMRQFDIELEN